jgi:glycosyltransferase involved in cell wall biosynthesis
MPRLLIATPNYWTSPYQVGSHNLARSFVRAGWEVAFISDPLSPWHLGRGFTSDFRRRFSIYRQGGYDHLDGRLWTYVPFAGMTPHNKPILRSGFVHRHWHRWTLPDVAAKVKERGFGRVDLLYIDSLHQSFWFDALEYEHAVYRVADYNPQFEKYTEATRQMEKAMAERADLVLYPSQKLKDYVDELGAQRTLYFPNGVDYEHFARPAPPPPEYASMRRPIAVYLGVIPAWFHFDWLRYAAKNLPDVSFVLIGPENLARERLAGLENIHLLGFRDYATVPAYLQHADVGLVPFDRERNPRGVEVLNPQKLYAYFASGIPVVCSDLEEVRRLGSPAEISETPANFTAALKRALTHRADPAEYRGFAARFDWQHCVQRLLQAVEAAKQAPSAA